MFRYNPKHSIPDPTLVSKERRAPQPKCAMPRSPQTSSWIDTDKHPRDGSSKVDTYTRRDIILRITIFTLLEIGFAILSARALIHPITLKFPIHITLTETKGGFQLLFIIWHALATMVIKDLVVYTYSSEWMFIHEQTQTLNSAVTDRASKLTSGFITLSQHFFSKLATRQFKIALVLALLLMGLNGLGPSTVFVTTSFVDVPVQMPLANVSLPDLNTNTNDPTAVSVTFQLALQRADIVLRMEYSTKLRLDTAQRRICSFRGRRSLQSLRLVDWYMKPMSSTLHTLVHIMHRSHLRF